MNSNCNTTTCPFCGMECGSHTRLIAHMIACAASSSRSPGGNGHRAIVAAIAAGIVAVSLLVAQPAKAQDVPAPQPTPTVGGGPQIAVEHRVFLPFVANGNDVKASVSWCPSCSPRR